MDEPSQNINPPKDTRQLLEENQQLLRMILRNTEKTRKYIFLGRVVSIAYIALIVGSLILAAITLPPLLNNYLAPYKELLSSPTSKGEVNQGIIDEVQNFLKDYNN
jgi:hypothetical protein